MTCKCTVRAKKVCGSFTCRRSFASHPRAKYWSTSLNEDEPHDIHISTNESFSFNCGHGHNFSYPLNKIVKNRQWCYYCINKTEIKLIDWLKVNCIDHKASTQGKFEWCRNPDTGRFLPFDITIPSLRLIIEVDGRQHYMIGAGWPSPVPMQRRDVYKMRVAVDFDWTVIRLLQESIWWDKDDWENRLKVHLRPHKNPRCILLDSDKCEYNPLRKIVAEYKIPGTNY